MPKTKVREITIDEVKGSFGIFKKASGKRKEYDFEGLQALKQLLNTEKARILKTIKLDNPGSIYDLAKKLGRSFKSVSDDLKLLERFGLIEFIEEKTKNRIRHKPQLITDNVIINLRI